MFASFTARDFHGNAAKGALCEASPSWVTSALDCIFRGQPLLMHRKNGERLMKPHGKGTWEELQVLGRCSCLPASQRVISMATQLHIVANAIFANLFHLHCARLQEGVPACDQPI